MSRCCQEHDVKDITKDGSYTISCFLKNIEIATDKLWRKIRTMKTSCGCKKEVQNLLMKEFITGKRRQIFLERKANEAGAFVLQYSQEKIWLKNSAKKKIEIEFEVYNFRKTHKELGDYKVCVEIANGEDRVFCRN